jgi:hypothetical protein
MMRAREVASRTQAQHDPHQSPPTIVQGALRHTKSPENLPKSLHFSALISPKGRAQEFSLATSTLHF